MKTYLQIIFNSEGASPSEIKNQLLNMGFQATKGNYDFVFDWEKKKQVSMILFFSQIRFIQHYADQMLHLKLKRFNGCSPSIV